MLGRGSGDASTPYGKTSPVVEDCQEQLTYDSEGQLLLEMRLFRKTGFIEVHSGIQIRHGVL